MNEPLRTYHFTDELRWSWNCTLFTDRLEFCGRNGKKDAKYTLELKHCNDWSVRKALVQTTSYIVQFVFTTLGIFALCYAAGGLVAFLLYQAFLENTVSDNVIAVVAWGAVFCVTFVPIFVAFVRRFRFVKRRLHRTACFRCFYNTAWYFIVMAIEDEPKDNVDLILAHRRFERWKTNSVFEPSDEFECFVLDAEAAIKRAQSKETE